MVITTPPTLSVEDDDIIFDTKSLNADSFFKATSSGDHNTTPLRDDDDDVFISLVGDIIEEGNEEDDDKEDNEEEEISECEILIPFRRIDCARNLLVKGRNRYDAFLAAFERSIENSDSIESFTKLVDDKY